MLGVHCANAIHDVVLGQKVIISAPRTQSDYIYPRRRLGSILNSQIANAGLSSWQWETTHCLCVLGLYLVSKVGTNKMSPEMRK